MNINAISNFNNTTNLQSFKAEPKKIYSDFNEIIPPEVSDDTVVDYSTWGSNYPIPITAGQRRAAQREKLAEIAAEAAARKTIETQKEELSAEEQRVRYLRD